jgi:hypothetical protein
VRVGLLVDENVGTGLWVFVGVSVALCVRVACLVRVGVGESGTLVSVAVPDRVAVAVKVGCPV